MQIPLLTDCLYSLVPDIKALIVKQASEFFENGEKNDFLTVISKLINEDLNPQIIEEKIKEFTLFSTAPPTFDATALVNHPLTELGKRTEDMQLNADIAEIIDYHSSAITESLKSFKNIELIPPDLIIPRDQNIGIKTDANTIQNVTVQDIPAFQISQDTQQLTQKSLPDAHSSIGVASDSEIEVNSKVSDSVAVPKENVREVDSMSFTKTSTKIIPISEEMDGLIDDPPTSILKQAVTMPSNKEINDVNGALKTKNYSLAKGEPIAIVQGKTLQSPSGDSSEQKETGYNAQNNKTAATENIPVSSGHGFPSFVNKAVLDSKSSLAQQLVRLNFPDIVPEKLAIINSDSKSLKLTIEPGGIGTLDIELTLEKGVVNAQIFASETAGKNFLDNNISALLNSLLREGLNIGKFSIFLGYKRDEAKNEHLAAPQKTPKTIDEIAISSNPLKNHLISIFV